MHLEIVMLPKNEWKHYILPMRYTTQEMYRVVMHTNEAQFQVELKRQPLDEPFIHEVYCQEAGDQLYADWWPNALAWGMIQDGHLLAAVEIAEEVWSNRLRVTEIWVDAAYRRLGLGHRLMAHVKNIAKQQSNRAIILETQSTNVPAIDFYLREGFELIGLDSCCYSNEDLQKQEVRLEFGYLLATNQ